MNAQWLGMVFTPNNTHDKRVTLVLYTTYIEKAWTLMKTFIGSLTPKDAVKDTVEGLL